MSTRRLVGVGLVATVAAMAATTAVAAVGRAAGVDLEISGEEIPLSGFAVVTGFFSLVGVVIAVALRRWSARPAERFAWTAASLTAISLVPPFLAEADTSTSVTLVGLHLIAAAVMIPVLVRSIADVDALNRVLRETAGYESSVGRPAPDQASGH